MVTYREVEQLRQKRHYVKYFDPTDKNVLEIDYTPQDVPPVYKDKFCLNLRKDLDSVYRQSKLIREILEEHDCNGENYEFKAIEFALKEMNIEEGYLSYLIKYIKIMTTIRKINIKNAILCGIAFFVVRIKIRLYKNVKLKNIFSKFNLLP